MNRRELLKLLASGLVGSTLDVDKLLWIPGQKTFFLPKFHTLSINDIVAIEMERILPQIKLLFERDDTFYSLLEKVQNRPPEIISSRPMRIPLIIEPGKSWRNK